MILGESILGLKWDSGAKYAVISVKVLNSDLSDKDLEGVKQYCDGHSGHREQFFLRLSFLKKGADCQGAVVALTQTDKDLIHLKKGTDRQGAVACESEFGWLSGRK